MCNLLILLLLIGVIAFIVSIFIINFTCWFDTGVALVGIAACCAFMALIIAAIYSNSNNDATEINQMHALIQNRTINEICDSAPETAVKLLNFNDKIKECKQSYKDYGKWSIYYNSDILKCKEFK